MSPNSYVYALLCVSDSSMALHLTPPGSWPFIAVIDQRLQWPFTRLENSMATAT